MQRTSVIDPHEGDGLPEPRPYRSEGFPARRRPPRRRAVWRWAATGGLAAAACLAWLAAATRPPDLHPLASLEAYAHDLETLAGALSTAAPGDPSSELSDGLAVLRQAPYRRLGLFPTSDTLRVDAALAHLGRAYEASADPVVRGTAAFFMAKAHLMRGDPGAARACLRDVVALDAVFTDDARLLLLQLARL